MPRNKQGLALCGVLVASLMMAGCQKEEKTGPAPEVIRPVKLTQIGDQSVSVRYFPAELKASEETDLAFRVSGELKSLPVVEGQIVSKGDLLAALDEDDLKLSVKQKRAAYDLAQLQQRRIREMVRQKAATQSQLDEVNTSLKQARTALEQAENQLEYSQIFAPFDGVIAKVYVDNYEFVGATAPVMKLENATHIDVSFQIPEDLVIRIQRGDSAYQPDIQISSVPDRNFKATYKEHSTNPDPSTRGYDVILTMRRPDENDITLLPGMTAEVQININELLGDKSYWLVPVEAVFVAENQSVDNPQKQVWVYDPDTRKLKKRQVTVGELDGDKIQITSGLSAGEQVVIAGVQALREGLEVRPWVKERGL